LSDLYSLESIKPARLNFFSKAVDHSVQIHFCPLQQLGARHLSYIECHPSAVRSGIAGPSFYQSIYLSTDPFQSTEAHARWFVGSGLGANQTSRQSISLFLTWLLFVLQVAVFSASASDEPVVAAAQAPPNVHALATGGLPTWFERLASALMFLLPLSEGIYR